MGPRVPDVQVRLKSRLDVSGCSFGKIGELFCHSAVISCAVLLLVVASFSATCRTVGAQSAASSVSAKGDSVDPMATAMSAEEKNDPRTAAIAYREVLRRALSVVDGDGDLVALSLLGLERVWFELGIRDSILPVVERVLVLRPADPVARPAGPESATTADSADTAELGRLIGVVRRLRVDCPWDAEQTHRSLVPYLLEESYEVVEAIETLPATADGAVDHDPGRHDHLVEELGDLLLQVIFHVVIAGEDDHEVTVARVAAGIADKLVTRHPHVFAGEEAAEDLNATWEARKAIEKGRRSVLEGIPDLPPLARATKIIGRSRARGVSVQLAAPTTQVLTTVGEQILALVAEADAAGVDPDQSLRDAVRGLEVRVRDAEST